jgi:hypothetical protein
VSKPRCIRCRAELAGVGLKQLGRAIVEAHLGLGLISDAVDRALLASARTGTRPTRRSIRTIALAWLGARVEREIDRRLAEVGREEERSAAA